MKMGLNGWKFAGLACLAWAIALPVAALGDLGSKGFYSGLGAQYSMAPHEDRGEVHHPVYYINDAFDGSTVTSPALSTVNGRLGVSFNEGYRFNKYLAAEVAGILYGQSRDNIGVQAIFSPWRSADSLNRFSLIGILGYSDGTFLPGYGFNFEHFTSRFQSFSAKLAMQPTVTYHQKALNCHYYSVASANVCSENLSDGRDSMTVWNVGIGYQYYFDNARRSLSAFDQSPVSHVLGIGSGQSILTYPTNYDEDRLTLNKWRFDTADVNLSHGLRFNPYYTLEFSGHYMLYRGDELRKRHLALWSFAHQLSSPTLAGGLFNVYAKAGSFYVNHRRGGIDYGLGVRLMSGAKSLTFGWERFDFRDGTLEPAPQYYYDLLGMKAHYRFGPSSTISRATLPVTRLQKPKRSLGLYMSFLSGSESAALDETSFLAHQKLALTGYQGMFGFGYQHRLNPNIDLGIELALGSSSDVYHAERFNNLTNSFAVAGHSAKELAYYASVLPSWSLEGDGSLYGRIGVVRSDWINDLPYGVVTSHDSASNNVSPLTDHKPMRTNGMVIGLGHAIPLTSQLSLSVEYDHAWYRHHDVTARIETTPVSATRSLRVSATQLANYNNTVFRYKPQEDKFMVGARYALSPSPILNTRASYFNKGLYAVLSAERDFHYMKRSTSTLTVSTTDINDDFYVSHGYLDGEGLRATVGYQWMVTPKLDTGIELYERQMDSSFDVRHHFSNEYWTYKARGSVGLRAMLGYALTPVARAYLHSGVLQTRFERQGNKAGWDLIQHEDNFKEKTLGFSMGVGSELAFSKKWAVRLEYSYAAYDAFGTGDPKEKGDLHWNYYRFSDDNYSLGVRYHLGS